MRTILLAAMLVLAGAAASWADSVNVGLLSFGYADSTNTTVSFTVWNYTGSLEYPCTVYTPCFPVTDSLDFQSVSLTLFGSGIYSSGLKVDLTSTDGQNTISSGNSGVTVPYDPSDMFTQAVLTVTFSLTSLNLDTGSVDMGGNIITQPFQGSASSTATLFDSSGQLLVNDQVFITDPPGGTSPVPEPGTLCLLVSGMAGLFLLRRTYANR